MRLKENKRREGREEGERRDQKECNFNGKSNEKNGREMKTKEGGAKIRQEKMVLVFVFPLFLVFLFSCTFPFEKNNRKNNEHVKEPASFQLGNKEKNRGDRARGGIC